MPCGGCGQTRRALVTSARSLDMRGVAQAMRTAVAINVDKIRGMSREEIDAKYGGNVRPATPYRRPPERTK